MTKIKVNKKNVIIHIVGNKFYPSLENLRVSPSGEEQTFNHPNSYGYDNVTVEAVETEQLDITPNTENQEFNGLYDNVKVAGDSDLLPENIKSGANIFGVEGNAPVADFEINDCSYLFYQGARENLFDVLLPFCKNITKVSSMFAYSQKKAPIDLSMLDTSEVTSMYQMFNSCSFTSINLSNFNTSKVTSMSNMFQYALYLEWLDLSSFDTSKVTSTTSMIANCRNLTKLIINRNDVFKMTNKNMLSESAIAKGTGYVYVPDNMVETYKSATNWSTYADQIKGMSELV